MKIILIAAMAKNRVIGRGNGIPWHIPSELQRFKAMTMGHTLIMGRKTFESIGRPLPGRKTVIITRNPEYHAPGCSVAPSLNAAIALCPSEETIFIAGGGEIYREALPLAEAIYLTVLDREVEGDTIFPEFDPDQFRTTSTERIAEPEPYTFTVFSRS
ncbi:MAG: dihydrofolate reductase [Proteobacteria bacterium]|nr:dihydrofolate reductase [Pseudomonadota bacterium]MBU1545442.1 dihydrofolate reductase [Pseudomonadota bacterium]MBU2618487.1 dihydrofolate reductase [Pseudomonadota bacterium]